MVGPLVSLFSCSDRWIPLERKLVLVALSALGFVFPTFNLTFWKSSCRFFFLDFISAVYNTAVCDDTRHAGECIDLLTAGTCLCTTGRIKLHKIAQLDVRLEKYLNYDRVNLH